jgi:hypothetical protein
METQTLTRAGAVCAGLGAVVTGVSWIIHPELAEPAKFLPIVAGSSHFVGIHWSLIIGMVLMQFGLAALTLTLREQPAPNDAGAWAQLGLYALLVGLALWIGVFMTEVALKPLAEQLTADPTLTGGALALAGLVDVGGTAASFVYSLGVALLGIALLVSRRFPRWTGAAGLVLGAVLSLGLGLPRMFVGKSVWTEQIGSPILGALVLVWVFVLGVMLWRMAGAGQRQR